MDSDVASAPAEPQSAEDSYDQIESEIRERMVVDVALIREPGELEDTMYVELQRVGLRVVSINAEVLEWYGRQEDVPHKVDFRIRIRSREGQLDRELGAAAIVIGKYIARYDLSVPRFDIVFEFEDRDPAQWSLNPDIARDLYNKRITLLEFLNTLR